MQLNLTKILNNVVIREEEKREYIGASSIGNNCMRALWYEYTGAAAAPFTKKLLRTFEIGHRLEEMVIVHLVKAGLNIIRYNKTLSDRFEPLFKGHVDAILNHGSQDEAIIEIKTASHSRFNSFVKKGLRAWSERYFAQMQAYMGMANIRYGYLIAINKDNSEVHHEFVNFDNDYYNRLRDKARQIIVAVTPPPKINESPLWFECRMCKFKTICHS